MTQIHAHDSSSLSPSGHFYSCPVGKGEQVYPGTFALDTCGANIIDYIGQSHFPVWIIEPRRMFIDNDRIVALMQDGRLFTGKSKLLTSDNLIIRNNKNINCEVIDFHKVCFMGRLIKGIYLL
ncbi:hypothetical protein ABNN70_13630 [Sporolactobacillus sp. Y61]|uniref:Peptidase S24/S26A/S26B/S26C domain-containing protein n=1 Tax=Sporolactobacillus sp. Y61 TaxID=3160863 RepID=A0AAU8IF93_9BACL